MEKYIQKNKTLFIEKYNFLVFVRVIFSTGLKKIYLLDSMNYFEHSQKNKNFFEKISCWILPSIEIIRVPFYQRKNSAKKDSDICWQANRIALEFLDSDHFNQSVNKVSAFFTEEISDRNILIAIKKLFLPAVFQKIIFFTQLIEMHKEGIEVDEVILNSSDHLDIVGYLKSDFLTNKVKGKAHLLISIRNLLSKISFIIFSPLLIRDIFSRGVSFINNKSKTFDTAIHIAWGFDVLENKKGYVKRSMFDDELLKSGQLDPKKTIYVTDKWNFDSKSRNLFDKCIKELGASSTNIKKLKIPIGMLFKNYLYIGYFKMLLKVIEAIRRGIKIDSSFLFCIQKIYLSYLHHELFCKYYQVKVFVSRDDYHIDHVTRTIVQNNHGYINVCVQHSAFAPPAYQPNSAHTYCDRYYTAGSDFRELWYPFWETNKKIIPVGPHRDHKIIAATQDSSIKMKFKKKYSDKVTILLLFSKPDNGLSPESLIQKQYHDIHRLIEIDDRLHLILRPRDKGAIEPFLNLFPEVNDCMEMKRATIETDDFTTQELIACADILVTEDNSSCILEAVCLDNLMIITLAARYPVHKYQKGITAYDMPELIHIIQTYISNRGITDDFKNSIKTIRDNFTVQPPGRTWIRIAEDIKQQLDFL